MSSEVKSNPYTVAILTISDKGHAGTREDLSGLEIEKLVTAQGYTVVHKSILPDERDQISAALIRLAEQQVCLILTTGGTGFAVRDVTPEATLDVADRLCPGIPEAMRAYSLGFTKRAMLSRAVAGMRGKSLIINLPGSPKSVRECLEFILDSVEHGLDIMIGRDAECAR